MVLLALVLLARLALRTPERRGAYLAVVLVASLVFYGWYVPWYLALMLFSPGVDWYASLRIAALPVGHPARRRWLALSLGVNLAILGFFKYANFAVDNVRELATILGLPSGAPRAFELMLPIGISFYTFEAMSYTIDAYRGTLVPVRRFRDFLLFVSFFPHLVAGPIVRARDFLRQIPRHRPPRAAVWLQGGWLVVQGYFLKMVVADNLATLVDPLWAGGYEPGANASTSLLLAILFAAQILCDFGGYSSIACGLAYWLGFRLPENFNSPYVAVSFQEFWRRWHITLSTWLRDYLYVPLGGNRRGRVRTHVNLMLTMLLGGLWHGASWTFVLWGGLHGAALVVERLLGLDARRGRRGAVATLLWAVVVQAVVVLAWVFFRSDTAAHAVAFLRPIVAGRFGPLDPALAQAGVLLLLPVFAMHARSVACERFGLSWPGPVEKGLWAGFMVWAIVSFHATNQTFIYFQF